MAGTTFANAAAAYAANASRAIEGAGKIGVESAQTAQKAGAGGFAELVGQALESARDSGVAAEKSMTQAVMGQTGLHDVVAAVSNAEVTLQTVMAVRDRVISAYQDIMRMPI